MSEWNMSDGGGLTETLGFVPSTSKGTGVVSGGSTNTKGSYVEFSSSTLFDSSGFWVVICQSSAIARKFLVDVAVGGVGSEEVILSNYLFDFGAVTFEGGRGYFPIAVPAGSRVSVRSQCDNISQTITLTIILCSRGFGNQPSFGRCTTYGAETADSGGTQVDPGSTANTKGAYKQISASTANDIKQFWISLGRNADSSLSWYRFSLDVAIGVAASEKIIIPNTTFISTGSGDIHSPRQLGPFNANIPAGSRLAIRSQSSGTNSTNRIFDVVIHGFD